MIQPVAETIRSALSRGLSSVTGTSIAPDAIRLPARGADAAWPGAVRPDTAGSRPSLPEAITPSCFPQAFGVPPVANVSEKNGWLLFTLSDAFFDAALAADPRPLPPERPEDGELRMKLMMLARHEPVSIPHSPALHRALLMLWAAEETPSRTRIEKAVLALLDAPKGLSPFEKSLYTRKLGGPARLALSIEAISPEPANN